VTSACSSSSHRRGADLRAAAVRREVIDAYLAGLQQAKAAGQDVYRIRSCSSARLADGRASGS